MVDPADEFISPYLALRNNPIAFIDPDGMVTYWVGGAGNDPEGWGYNNKIMNAFNLAGIQNPFPKEITQGPTLDKLYSATRINSSNDRYDMKGRGGPRILEPNTASLTAMVLGDIAEGKYSNDEQLNLSGYSFGSVVVAHTALELAAQGIRIDNVILVGSPIDMDSQLYKALLSNKNIGHVERIDINNDDFSGGGLWGTLKGAWDYIFNSGDSHPHFEYALPGNDTERADLASDLVDSGVK